VLGWADSRRPRGLAATWWTQWQADSMGILIVVPLMLNWSRRVAAKPHRKTLEMLCLALPTLARRRRYQRQPAGYPASLPLTFVILPFVIWAALRFEQREVATVNAMICASPHGIRSRAAGRLRSRFPALRRSCCSRHRHGGHYGPSPQRRGRRAQPRHRGACASPETLRRKAIRDPLTNLYNRRFLHDYLSPRAVRAIAKPPPRRAHDRLDHFKR